MTNSEYMLLALKYANSAYKHGDVPVGAVIVKDDKVIAHAFNKKDKRKVATYHAEILCIERACKALHTDKLVGASIYVTKEPCIMCLGACMTARLDNVYFGAYDKRYGVQDIAEKIKFNHRVNLVGGIEEARCSEILTKFFKNLREK